MEMAIANIAGKGENVLVCSNGFFGDRFIDLCERKGLNLDVLPAKRGESVTPEQVESRLAAKDYQLVTVTHVETSTGVAAPIAEIARIVRKKSSALYVVDGVAATGGVEETIDPMGIDVLLTCSQKAFGVSPGLAMLWAGKRAMEKRATLGRIPESYIDFDKWLPIMHNPAKYWGTPPVNLIWALKESLRIMKEEGLEERYARHERQGALVDAALEAIGFTVAAKKPFRAPTLSVYLYPEGSGIDDTTFRTMLAEEGVQSAGCLGDFQGKGFRMGHMGNIDKHTLVSAVGAVERACAKSGYRVQFGKALGVLQEGLAKE
jgi:aspartate aminotransferase-like enzyme